MSKEVKGITTSHGYNADIYEQLKDIKARLDALGFKEGVFAASSSTGSLTFSESFNNVVKKQGKYALGTFRLEGSGVTGEVVISVPDEFKPKMATAFIGSLFDAATNTETYQRFGIGADGTIHITNPPIVFTLYVINFGWEIE